MGGAALIGMASDAAGADWRAAGAGPLGERVPQPRINKPGKSNTTIHERMAHLHRVKELAERQDRRRRFLFLRGGAASVYSAAGISHHGGTEKEK